MHSKFEAQFEKLSDRVDNAVSQTEFNDLIQSVVDKEAFDEVKTSNDELRGDFDGFKSTIQREMSGFVDRLKEIDDKITLNESNNGTLISSISKSIAELKGL